MKRKVKRRIIILALILGIIFFWWFSTFTLSTHRVTIESNKIKNEIKIVHLTDLHGASFGRNNSCLIRRIQKENPDIICVTGDMYTGDREKGKDTALALLAALAESYDVYYVNGEHDAGQSFQDELKEQGVKVLDYETERITVGETIFNLYGITNQYYSPTFDLANEFELNKTEYNILLAHIPYFSRFADFGMDLSLCGDTHGGQIRLPFIGGIYNAGVWFPEITTSPETSETYYVKGLYQRGEARMFISSGLGNYPIPIRFLNRPEVAVITLCPMEK